MIYDPSGQLQAARPGSEAYTPFRRWRLARPAWRSQPARWIGSQPAPALEVGGSKRPHTRSTLAPFRIGGVGELRIGKPARFSQDLVRPLKQGGAPTKLPKLFPHFLSALIASSGRSSIFDDLPNRHRGGERRLRQVKDAVSRVRQKRLLVRWAARDSTAPVRRCTARYPPIQPQLVRCSFLDIVCERRQDEEVIVMSLRN